MSESTVNEIEPCPLCSGKCHKDYIRKDNGCKLYWVGCCSVQCSYRIRHYYTLDEAIKAHNTLCSIWYLPRMVEVRLHTTGERLKRKALYIGERHIVTEIRPGSDVREVWDEWQEVTSID